MNVEDVVLADSLTVNDEVVQLNPVTVVQVFLRVEGNNLNVKNHKVHIET